MEGHELDAIVAATLAAGSLSATGNHAAAAVVERYRAILKELRKTGGALGGPEHQPIKVSQAAIDAIPAKRAR
jgi:hypothetical protein